MLTLKFILAITLSVITAFAGAPQAEPSDPNAPTLDIRFEPSGTHVDNKGNLKIRLDFYPQPDDKNYALHHVYVVDETSPEYLAGYKGVVDKDGNPVDPVDYQKWLDGLPHIWKINPALCHFIIVSPDITKEQLDAYVKNTFNSSVTATIDDAMIQANSAHLISPYMKTKAATTGEKIPPSTDKNLLIASINTRLADYKIIDGKMASITEQIQPQSITIGPGATNRASSTGGTIVDNNVAADGDGTLDTWEFWFASNASNVEAATFYVVSGNNLSTRDTETIGAVTSGSKQTFSGLSTDVITGDHAGYYATAGSIERTTSGNSWYDLADKIPCTNYAFSTSAFMTISIYATGTESGGAAFVPKIKFY